MRHISLISPLFTQTTLKIAAKIGRFLSPLNFMENARGLSHIKLMSRHRLSSRITGQVLIHGKTHLDVSTKSSSFWAHFVAP